jgi:periplasmic copper chaperone A
VSDAWARSSPSGVSGGAAYVTIESAADDQLTGVSVPADVAASVELHETVAGDGAAADTAGHDPGSHATEGSGATMTMRQVSAVDLPAGEPVVFGPGGLHVMLIGLAGPLESGSSFELTLTFAAAEPLTVTVDVRDEAP